MKNIYKLFAIFTAVFAMSSCLKDQEELFEGMPTDRVTKKVAAVSAKLTSTQQGWILDYFSNPTILPGAYTMGLTFSETATESTVSVSGEAAFTGDRTIVVRSSYIVKPGEGAVLSFDTYNEIFHFFSDPYPNNEGFGGDFEFIVTTFDDTSISLSGVKHRMSQVLRKLPAGTTVAQYLTQQAAMIPVVNSFVMPVLDVNGDKVILIRSEEDRVYDFKFKDTSYSAHFAITSTGIYFYEPVVLNGISIQHFDYNSSSDKFVCTDPGATAVTIEDLDVSNHLIRFLLNGRLWFKTGVDNMSTKFAAEWAIGTSAFTSAGYAPFNRSALGTLGATRSLYVNFAGGYGANMNYSFIPDPSKTNAVVVTYLGTTDSNGGIVAGWPAFGSILRAVGYLSGKTYTMTETPTTIRFDDVNDAESWFVLYKTQTNL